MSLKNALVQQHLHESRHIVGVGKQSRMTSHAAHHGRRLVVHIAPHQLTAKNGVVLRRGNLLAGEMLQWLVTDMRSMFSLCKALTTLDLSGFDTNNVTNMSSMFRNCVNLTSLDLSNFDTSKVTHMDNMFSGCENLKRITLGENFKTITPHADLPNGDGWVNVNDPSTIVSSEEFHDSCAVIENYGNNTYVRYFRNTPTNIKADHSEQYHQIRFTWDKVDDAQQYGIAVYLAGKWRIQAQNITGTTYTTPKNLTPGKTYKVAVAARVDGKWYTSDAIKNAVDVTVK